MCGCVVWNDVRTAASMYRPLMASCSVTYGTRSSRAKYASLMPKQHHLGGGQLGSRIKEGCAKTYAHATQTCSKINTSCSSVARKGPAGGARKEPSGCD